MSRLPTRNERQARKRVHTYMSVVDSLVKPRASSISFPSARMAYGSELVHEVRLPNATFLVLSLG